MGDWAWFFQIHYESITVVIDLSLAEPVSPEDREAASGDQEPGKHTHSYCKNDSLILCDGETGECAGPCCRP